MGSVLLKTLLDAMDYPACSYCRRRLPAEGVVSLRRVIDGQLTSLRFCRQKCAVDHLDLLEFRGLIVEIPVVQP